MSQPRARPRAHPSAPTRTPPRRARAGRRPMRAPSAAAEPRDPLDALAPPPDIDGDLADFLEGVGVEVDV